jgi:peptidyl-prolyl cis-trans isomerase D
MLQKLHEGIKGWVAGAIIAIISLVFVLWGVEYYLQPGNAGGNTIAKVDGRKITEKELNLTFQQLQRQYTVQKGGLLTSQQNAELKQLALQQLISTNVLLHTADEAGFRVSRAQVNQLITSLPQFQKEGQFSLQRYQQFLYANSLTSTQFIRRANDSLLMEQVQAGIQGSSFLLSDEAKHGFDLSYQKRDFSYLVVPSARFIQSVKLSPAQIKQYYQQHRDDYKTPEKVSIAYLMLSPEKISQQVKVSEAEIKQYYQDNKGNYRTPRRWKVDRIFLSIPKGAIPKQVHVAQHNAQQLVDRIKQGARFDTVMKEQAGVTQWVNETKISSQFAQALSALKPGEVSQPLRTSEGISIVRVVQAQAEKMQPFASVKAQIKRILVQQKTNAILTKMSDQLSSITYTNPNTLQSAAKALNLPIQTSSLFARAGEKSGLLADPKVVSAAFSEDVLQGGNNSNVIELNNGGVVVLRVKQHVVAEIPPLKDVSAQIEQHMKQQLAKARAAVLAVNLQAALNQGKPIAADVMKEYSLHWIDRSAVTRDNKKTAVPVLTAAFNLTLQKGHSVTTATLSNGDVAVVKLTGIKLADYAGASEKQQQVLQRNMLRQVGQLEYQLYTKSAYQHTKVKNYMSAKNDSH